MRVHTKVPYVKSLMFSFKHTSPIFIVGRESIRENYILSADTQEKQKTGTRLDREGWVFT